MIEDREQTAVSAGRWWRWRGELGVVMRVQESREVGKYWKVWSRQVLRSYFHFKRITGLCIENRM